MKRTLVLISWLLVGLTTVAGERIENVPFGDFEQWAVRYIKESKLLGGKTKVLYAVAPVDTIRANTPFQYGKHNNPWSVSNAYAKVGGVEKASGTTRPERRGNGWCARLDCKLDSVVAMKVIDLKVLVAGTLFTGRTIEPVTMKGANDPYGVIDMGVPFTKHPKALMIDYKARVENSNEIVYAKAVSKPRKREGRDCAEIYIYFQHRWEDPDGTVHAYRVGTCYERIWNSVPEWRNNHRIPIRWGDITKQADYHDYEGLNQHLFRTTNSQGKLVRIQEEGFSDDAPTHMIMMITSGRYEAFVGHAGNTLWVDNVRFVYED
ncbi:MAG: PCMD domain-containing protein [Paludibacteraceae bacterium]|nr:PCMD domain-containing protein [Paludibacteraceae bacterium]